MKQYQIRVNIIFRQNVEEDSEKESDEFYDKISQLLHSSNIVYDFSFDEEKGLIVKDIE